MLDTIDTIFQTTTTVFALYFALISVFALLGKKKEKQTDKQLKFAVLIAARNESSCIAGIITSLQKQNYPPDLLDIIVVPNNCTDHTAQVAAEAGAMVLPTPSTVKCKGAALQYAMNQLMEGDEHYDAFMVFDADNEASPQFVAAMNRTLCNGANVVKSRIFAKNQTQSWVATCYDIFFCSANLFLNRARVRIGLSARLIGTGFCVTCDYLDKIHGFQTKTMTEDAEFYAICAGNGEKIAFCEDAITYDEEPLDFKTSMTQRKRWMSGIMQVFILKLPHLLKGLFRPKSARVACDALIQFSFAYVQAFLPFVLLLALVNSPVAFISSLPLSMLIAYLGSVANAIFVLTLEKRISCNKHTLLGIVLFPLFLLSFIPLQTFSLFHKTRVWKHTGVRASQFEQPISHRKKWFPTRTTTTSPCKGDVA